MRKPFLVFLLFFPGIFFLTGCSLKKPPSALQINTTSVANVFIEGKLVGKTPYQVNDLKAGEIAVKLIPEAVTDPLVSWEGKVKLNAGVLTLIEQEFASSLAGLSGQVLTLEQTKTKSVAGLTIISDPDGTLVNLDGETKGFAPFALEEVAVGDHQISLSKEGYQEKIIKARAIAGYKLIVSAKLAQEQVPTLASPSASPSLESGKTEGKVRIKETPTGWLRVRQGPSVADPEVARVNPKEEYPVIGEKTGWYKISLEDAKEGWISSQYAEKI